MDNTKHHMAKTAQESTKKIYSSIIDTQSVLLSNYSQLTRAHAELQI